MVVVVAGTTTMTTEWNRGSGVEMATGTRQITRMAPSHTRAVVTTFAFFAHDFFQIHPTYIFDPHEWRHRARSEQTKQGLTDHEPLTHGPVFHCHWKKGKTFQHSQHIRHRTGAPSTRFDLRVFVQRIMLCDGI